MADEAKKMEGMGKKEAQAVPQQRTIKDLSVDELKILVYDKSIALGSLQKELEILNQEIISRRNPTTK